MWKYIPPEYDFIKSSMNFSTNTMLGYENSDILRLMDYKVSSIFFYGNDNLIFTRNVTSVFISNLTIDSCSFTHYDTALLFEGI